MVSVARRLLQVLVICAILGPLGAAPAFGHADLVSTDPADGEELSTSPEAIELVFTAAVEPIGSGVNMSRDDGVIVDTTVSQPDETRIVLTPVAPLDSGGYIVDWTVTSGDSHVVSGVFTFSVDAPVPTENPGPGGDGAAAPAEASPTTATTVPPTEATASHQAQETDVIAVGPQFEALDSTTGEWLARIGRWIAMLGALVAIGAFAFSWTAFSGSRTEVRGIVRWIRACGVLLVGGALLEAIGASMVLAAASGGGLSIDAMSEILTGSYRWAIALRVAGGGLLIWGVSSAANPVDSTPAPSVQMGSDSSGGTDLMVSPSDASPSTQLDVSGSVAGLVGVALVAASYLFDGHTVVAAPSLVARIADLVHVLSGGVWLGGLVMMSWLFASRKKRGVPVGAAPIAVRFSRIAFGALLGVAIAGTLLAATILDSPSELTSTPWGRLLILKVILVAVAAAIGAYNHFRVVPGLEVDSQSEVDAGRLTRLVTVEGAVLVLVLLVTALLVGSAS